MTLGAHDVISCDDQERIVFSAEFLDNVLPAVEVDHSTSTSVLGIIGTTVTISIRSWPGGVWRIIAQTPRGWLAKKIGEVG